MFHDTLCLSYVRIKHHHHHYYQHYRGINQKGNQTKIVIRKFCLDGWMLLDAAFWMLLFGYLALLFFRWFKVIHISRFCLEAWCNGAFLACYSWPGQLLVRRSDSMYPSCLLLLPTYVLPPGFGCSRRMQTPHHQSSHIHQYIYQTHYHQLVNVLYWTTSLHTPASRVRTWCIVGDADQPIESDRLFKMLSTPHSSYSPTPPQQWCW